MAEELTGVGLFFAQLGVKMALESAHGTTGEREVVVKAAIRVVAELRDLALGGGVADRGAVVGRDIPINFSDFLFVFGGVGGGGGHRSAPRDILTRGGVVGRVAGSNRRIIRVAQALVATGARAFEFLVIQEEEETVLEDRATESDAIRLALQLGRDVGAGEHVFTNVLALEFLAEEFVAAEVVVNRTLVGVGAALGDGVDARTGEAGLTDVVGRNLNGELLDRVEREGIEEGSETGGVEAELVVDAGTVDLNRVVAVILTDRGDLSLFAIAAERANGDQGRGADHIGEGALRRGLCADALTAENIARTGGGAVQIIGSGGDFESLEGQDFGTRFQSEVLADVLAEDGVDFGTTVALETGGGDADVVGSAYDHTAEVEPTVGACGGRVGGAGRRVRGGHSGTGHRFARLVADESGHAGGNDLREGGWREREREEKGERLKERLDPGDGR